MSNDTIGTEKLALIQIARVADKILLMSFPVRDWDGSDFVEEEVPETGKTALKLGDKTRPVRPGEPWIIHHCLLNELKNAMLDYADIVDPEGKDLSDELRD